MFGVAPGVEDYCCFMEPKELRTNDLEGTKHVRKVAPSAMEVDVMVCTNMRNCILRRHVSQRLVE